MSICSCSNAHYAPSLSTPKDGRQSPPQNTGSGVTNVPTIREENNVRTYKQLCINEACIVSSGMQKIYMIISNHIEEERKRGGEYKEIQCRKPMNHAFK